jgi:HK97 family phage portal protein
MALFDQILRAIRGEHLPKTQRALEQKFSPGDPTVNWSYVNHLVYTANTTAYGGDGTGDSNSAVFACLLALSMGSIEPPLSVFKRDTAHGGELEPQPDNPIQAFFDAVNPELDIDEIRFWTSWAKHTDGNAYLVKVRSSSNTTGLPVQLWPVSPTRMQPKTARGSKNFIDYYEYREYDDGPPEVVPVENVIHFKLGVDPYDMRKGLSPLKRLLREIASDAEATKFSDALLKNFGVPGLVASLPADSILSPDQTREMKDAFQREFGGGNRGKFGILSGGANMQQFGFSPDDLNLEILHNFPETRIAAVMGVDPLVARLGVGLEQTSNYASAKQVRENFTELTLIPSWRMDESKWNRKLKVDFTSDPSIVIKHDLSEVRALQEDENAKAERLERLVKAGIIPVQAAARELGYDPEWAPGSLFYVSPNVTYVAIENLETDPAVAAAAQAQAAADRAAALNAGVSNPPNSVPPKKAMAFSDLAQALVDASVDGFTEDLQRLQDAQQKRLTRALVEKGS